MKIHDGAASVMLGVGRRTALTTPMHGSAEDQMAELTKFHVTSVEFRRDSTTSLMMLMMHTLDKI